jgi:hypothetical protein
MVNIKVNIQKKDLFLIAAIVVFMVGVGMIIGYNPSEIMGNPAVMGHTANEINFNAGFFINDQNTGKTWKVFMFNEMLRITNGTTSRSVGATYVRDSSCYPGDKVIAYRVDEKTCNGLCIDLGGSHGNSCTIQATDWKSTLSTAPCIYEKCTLDTTGFIDVCVCTPEQDECRAIPHVLCQAEI